MKTNVRLIKTTRVYSEDFKRTLTKEFESGKFSAPQLARLHKIAPATIYRWIYKYSTFNEHGSRVVEMKKSSISKLKALEAKVAELERLVGQKQIQVDYLEKMMELAKSEYNIDIKKNFDTPPSGGSGKTKAK